MFTIIFLLITLPLFISTFYSDEELNEAEHDMQRFMYEKKRYSAKSICTYSDAAQLARYHNQIWEEEHKP